ncbi:MAG: hypothetical protein JO025_01925 [Verrucomicrobia bacterium]|nr:hypothetical protein [Verrucomicrobiota bacterium]
MKTLRTIGALSLALASLGHTALDVPGLKPCPTGVYVVLPDDDPALTFRVCWSDPNIRGVLLRAQWSSVEPAQGVFDWSYFDAGIALCRTYNKLAQLQINCGLLAPTWVYTNGATIWYPTSGGQMPCPWCPVMQSSISELIAAFGSRYDSNPTVTSVTMWAGGKNLECFFAQTQDEIDALQAAGGPSVWANASKRIIAMFAAAFPTTQLYLACGNAFSEDIATMTRVALWARATYKRRIGLQSNALSVHYPCFTPSAGYIDFPHTTIPMDKVRWIGYQMVAPIRGQRMEGETLAECLQNALNCNADWVQIYPGDPGTDPGESSIIAFNAAVDG